MKGSPVYPSGQTHDGVWFNTIQLAPDPHDPGQGSLHFSLIQAKLLKQSEFIIHSGRQFGGDPVYSGKQLQEAEPCASLH